jgi:hypothetical protein
MKRRGVIGYLAAAAAALMGQSSRLADTSTPLMGQAGTSTRTTSISESRTLSLELVDEKGDGYGISRIDLHYKGEHITLTSQEIWEALKGN